MSKLQFISSRYRGVYDGNTLYRMFDEVLDVPGGTRYVLLVPEARGQSCKDLNLWSPVSDAVELDGTATSVKNFGAKGDGVTDDTDAILEAIDAVSAAGGGTVLLPAGTYKITDTLVVPKLVQLVGAGRGSIIKQYSNSIPIVQLAGETDAFRCGVKDLELRFNTAQTNPGGVGIQLGGTGIMCYESWIENVYIDQAYNGVACRNLAGGHAFMNRLVNVKAYRSHHYGFNFINPDEGACTTTTFMNCYAMQDHDAVKLTAGGFYIRNMTDCTMIGCAVDDLKEGRALFAMSSNLSAHGLHIENCHIVSESAAGMAVVTVSGGMATLIGMRLDAMEIDKPNGECCTFDVNTDSHLTIIGMKEYGSHKTAGDHYAVVPDGDNAEVYVHGWRGMLGAFSDASKVHVW